MDQFPPVRRSEGDPKRMFLPLFLFWSLVIVFLATWEYHKIREFSLQIATREALSNYEKDVAFRDWASTHGGVYVPVDKRTPPNPYLSNVPERDITTPSGRHLTLMNPAYMARQLNEQFATRIKIFGHITSLKLKNPINVPDNWERQALEDFEKGVPERIEISDINGAPYLRLVRPIFTKESCLKCHGEQGYKAGDIRGGVSVSVPMRYYNNEARKDMLWHGSVLGVLWLLGMAGLYGGYRAEVRSGQYRRREEEERRRLYAAIEQSGETVVITDARADILYVNHAFEMITGYTRAEALGKNPRLLKSGRQDEGFYRQLWGTITKGGVWSGRFVNKRKDGTLYEEEATISPVLDTAGNITNYVAIKRDISREAMLARAKDYFISITSHEMATPLSMLLLIRSILSKGSGGDAAERETVMKALEEAIARYERITSTTAMLSNIALEAGRGTLRAETVLPLVEHAVKEARGKALKAGRRVNVHFDAAAFPPEAKVMCDHAMFERMTAELLSNAVKYTPDGTEVKVVCRAGAGTFVMEIGDEGSGIPRKERETVFEPFFSLENPMHHVTGSYTYKGGGIGLGLTLARMITEYHGGRITLSSQGEGKGTTVTITLKLAPE